MGSGSAHAATRIGPPKDCCPRYGDTSHVWGLIRSAGDLVGDRRVRSRLEPRKRCPLVALEWTDRLGRADERVGVVYQIRLYAAALKAAPRAPLHSLACIGGYPTVILLQHDKAGNADERQRVMQSGRASNA